MNKDHVGITDHKIRNSIHDVINDSVIGGGEIKDVTESLQRTLDKSHHLVLPPGRFKISRPLSIPSEATIHGAGTFATTIVVPNDSSFAVFDIDGKRNIHLSGFSIKKENGNPTPAALVKLYGIQVGGQSSDTLIENIHVDGCFRGFNIAGGEGHHPGISQRVTLRDCLATHSTTPTANTGQFGFNIDDCDQVTLINCHANHHWLDGLKLRKKTRNVTIMGGSFNHNGEAKAGGGAGDGIDAYAGGDTFNFSNIICEHNYGNGITIKTGPLNNPPDAANYGYVKNANLSGLRMCHNAGNGVYIGRSSSDEPSEPLVSGITIHGGLFEGNGLSGIYLRGRNISAIAPFVKGNGREGITVAPNTFDADIIAPKVLANATNKPGYYPGILISGTRIKIRGGTINGKDANTVTQDGDYAALTAMHNHGIVISDKATDVLIDEVEVMHSASPVEFLCKMTKGICIINQKGEDSPEGKRYGGPGSRYIQINGAPGSILYLKQSGFDVSGWKPLG